MSLQGKVAIVTGGGAGIGQGIVNCLAEEGADVAVFDINSANAEEVARQVRTMGRSSLAVEANATDGTDAEKSLQKVLDHFHHVDILVNNVGGEARFYNEKAGEDYSEEKEWDDTVRLNLKSTMIMCRLLAPLFIRQHSGKIVNIASVAGRPASGGGMRSGGMRPPGFLPWAARRNFCSTSE